MELKSAYEFNLFVCRCSYCRKYCRIIMQFIMFWSKIWVCSIMKIKCLALTVYLQEHSKNFVTLQCMLKNCLIIWYCFRNMEMNMTLRCIRRCLIQTAVCIEFIILLESLNDLATEEFEQFNCSRLWTVITGNEFSVMVHVLNWIIIS